MQNSATPAMPLQSNMTGMLTPVDPTLNDTHPTLNVAALETLVTPESGAKNSLKDKQKGNNLTDHLHLKVDDTLKAGEDLLRAVDSGEHISGLINGHAATGSVGDMLQTPHSMLAGTGMTGNTEKDVNQVVNQMVVKPSLNEKEVKAKFAATIENQIGDNFSNTANYSPNYPNYPPQANPELNNSVAMMIQPTNLVEQRILKEQKLPGLGLSNPYNQNANPYNQNYNFAAKPFSAAAYSTNFAASPENLRKGNTYGDLFGGALGGALESNNNGKTENAGKNVRIAAAGSAGHDLYGGSFVTTNKDHLKYAATGGDEGRLKNRRQPNRRFREGEPLLDRLYGWFFCCDTIDVVKTTDQVVVVAEQKQYSVQN